MKGQFKKGKSGNVWYLTIFGDENVLKIFANIWKSIRAKIDNVHYNEDYMKIKFESNDILPTHKTVNIYLATIIIRSVFAQNGKF